MKATTGHPVSNPRIHWRWAASEGRKQKEKRENIRKHPTNYT